MSKLETLRNELPEYAKDTKLNLQSVMQNTVLSDDQAWGVAVTAAATAGNRRLLDAVLEEAGRRVDDAVIEDALAATSIMGMNNVYYRFRHLVGKPGYSQKPARLRMNRLVKPATNKVDFELFSLAASAITGCEACIRAHEEVVVEGGLSEDGVHDAVRIAATMKAAAVSLDLPTTASVEATS